jgi:hypothetical protein
MILSPAKRFVVRRIATPQSMPIEKWAEVIAGASAGRPPRNDAGSLYSEADRITGRPGSEFLVQHLREVAIDHTNGVFAGTNDFVEKIGGSRRSPSKLLWPSTATPSPDRFVSAKRNVHAK